MSQREMKPNVSQRPSISRTQTTLATTGRPPSGVPLRSFFDTLSIRMRTQSTLSPSTHQTRPGSHHPTFSSNDIHRNGAIASYKRPRDHMSNNISPPSKNKVHKKDNSTFTTSTSARALRALTSNAPTLPPSSTPHTASAVINGYSIPTPSAVHSSAVAIAFGRHLKSSTTQAAATRLTLLQRRFTQSLGSAIHSISQPPVVNITSVPSFPHRPSTSSCVTVPHSNNYSNNTTRCTPVHCATLVDLKTLTIEQAFVMDLIKRGHNIMLTGRPGTGKSYLLRAMRQVMPSETTFFTASTAEVAHDIGGNAMTVHRQTGVAIGDKHVNYYFAIYRQGKNKIIKNFWDNAKCLFIDEISMLNRRVFEKLDALARLIRNKPDVPFGGIQLICSGDFLQLAPVPDKDPDTKKSHPIEFVFEADGWRSAIRYYVELTQNKRQEKDVAFQNILEELRNGTISNATLTLLQAQDRPLPKRHGITATRIYARNYDVDRENNRCLTSLSGKVHTFEMTEQVSCEDDLRVLNDMCTAPNIIQLKIGAQVMGVINSSTIPQLYNGARGIVEHFSVSTGFPVVRFSDGSCVEIAPYEWKVLDPFCGKTILASRWQIPLRLAYAISIHRCQGKTLDQADVDVGCVFAEAMVFVALSRVRSLRDVRIRNLRREHIKPVHEKVSAFLTRFLPALELASLLNH